eukprot:1139636-Pelagomonas_calceolata.AAC.4
MPCDAHAIQRDHMALSHTALLSTGALALSAGPRGTQPHRNPSIATHLQDYSTRTIAAATTAATK